MPKLSDVSAPASNRYTPGHSDCAVGFMAARSAESHAGFFLPELRRGMSLLDCGCGPGTITLGLARAVAHGVVHGVDLVDHQFTDAQAHAATEGLPVTFHRASAYALPFEDASFDAVFSHALLEHLSEPVGALREMARVLRPSGVLGVCSPDWGGFIVTPPSEELSQTLSTYMGLQHANGGNPLAGRFLGTWALEAGFTDIRVDARYECYEHPEWIADYLASQLEPDARPAQTLRDWVRQPGVMFAQTWVSVVALRN